MGLTAFMLPDRSTTTLQDQPMITSETILQNVLFPGKTQQVLQLVEEIHQAQATLQEKLFQLDSIVNGSGGVRKLPETVMKLLPAPAKVTDKKSARIKKNARKAKEAVAAKKPTDTKKLHATSSSVSERRRRFFTSEFKAKVVSAILNHKKRLIDASKEFGVGESNLREWVQIAVAKAQRDKLSLAQEVQDRYALSPYFVAACEETKSILKTAKAPLPTSKMRLKKHNRATLYRALAFLKELGDITSSGKGREVLYTLSKEPKSSNGAHVN